MHSLPVDDTVSVSQDLHCFDRGFQAIGGSLNDLRRDGRFSTDDLKTLNFSSGLHHDGPRRRQNWGEGIRNSLCSTGNETAEQKRSHNR